MGHLGGHACVRNIRFFPVCGCSLFIFPSFLFSPTHFVVICDFTYLLHQLSSFVFWLLAFYLVRVFISFASIDGPRVCGAEKKEITKS